MSPFNLQTCARRNILALRPFQYTRDDYGDDGRKVFLDANENSFGPSLLAADAATAAGARAIGINPLSLNQNVFVGVSSDESLDGLIRCFCIPGRDAILICPPTYGMYAVYAQANDVTTIEVPLSPAPEFQLDVDNISVALSSNPCIKLVFLASPGNPTGSLLSSSDIQQLLSHPTWNGVIVIDEAYIDYAPDGTSLTQLVTQYPNLVVVHTFSKAFGMAGIRLGVAFASASITALLNNLRSPYNISSPSSALASYCIGDKGLSVMRQNRQRMVAQRNRLLEELPNISGVGRMRGGTDGNFLLYEMLDAQGNPDNDIALSVFEKLAGIKGVVVRFRGKEYGCLGCLRITVGTEEDVTRLLDSP
ncbi:pyridoxal phosphate-dependent transferase [Xylogone sp. PMI_703]|nr:pyridoxal phosphate-dependent transferase [Xylogone sp. PMI_703]